MSSIAAVMLLSSALIALAGVPMWFGRIPPNRFYGFRTPRTVHDAAVWYPVNRLAGRGLTIGGVVAAVAVTLADLWVVDPLQGATLLVTAAMVPLFLSVLYGFWAASVWVADHDAANAEGTADPERRRRPVPQGESE